MLRGWGGREIVDGQDSVVPEVHLQKLTTPLTAQQETGRSRHMATLPRLPLCPPATHTQEGLVAPGGTTRSLHSSHMRGSAVGIGWPCAPYSQKQDEAGKPAEKMVS
ncbi:hypothetical protein INR49_014419 [Caranx melampygus]|nr:hypothetical protein INR49_014419 [Caranx melampygus]